MFAEAEFAHGVGFVKTFGGFPALGVADAAFVVFGIPVALVAPTDESLVAEEIERCLRMQKAKWDC